jgi:hypothetical protein
MNRFDLASLMKTTEEELFRPGGNFDTLFGHDPETVKQARFVLAIALTAADVYYARLTSDAFRLREADEHGTRIREEERT